MLEARPAVRNSKLYRPPLAGRNGLRLDFNENTVGASPRVLETLRKLDEEQLARYPEREPAEQIAARFLGLKPEEILLTNGVDEAIQLICHTYLEAGNEALIVVPAFAMYELFASATEARVIAVPALPDFRFPAEALLKNITPKTKLIAVANPNNPTGIAASREDLLRIAAAARQAAIFLDEAYFEFYGKTLIGEVGKFSNLFVARTFSKAYGLAGLRIGVLAGHAQQIDMVRKSASPYNVNAVALACLPAALQDQNFVDRYVAEVCRGRERLQAALRSMGIRYWESQANFVLACFGAHSQEFVAAMAGRGILVRDRSSDSGCGGCVRITIGTAGQMDKLLAALEATVQALEITERSPA